MVTYTRHNTWQQRTYVVHYLGYLARRECVHLLLVYPEYGIRLAGHVFSFSNARKR